MVKQEIEEQKYRLKACLKHGPGTFHWKIQQGTWEA